MLILLYFGKSAYRTHQVSRDHICDGLGESDRREESTFTVSVSDLRAGRLLEFGANQNNVKC